MSLVSTYYLFLSTLNIHSLLWLALDSSTAEVVIKRTDFVICSAPLFVSDSFI